MPLQENGPIAASDIRTEFEGSGVVSLAEYYRGGGNVPTGAGGNIPTSGPLAFSDFYGGANRIENPDPSETIYIDEADEDRIYRSDIVVIDESWTVPDLYLPTDYTVFMEATSTASYNCFGFRVSVYLDDVLIKEWYEIASHQGYFRYDSGTLAYDYTFSAEQEQVIRIKCEGLWRTTGPTPESTLKARLEKA